jgi:hypothetical protein
VFTIRCYSSTEGVWKLGVLRLSLLLRVFKRLTNDEIHVVVRITATKSKKNFVSRTKQDSRNEEVANCYSCAILEPPVYSIRCWHLVH